MVGFNFAPRGWAQCDGQLLPINQHQSLYALFGTIYGGDGRTNFALPDLRGRTPVHPGNGITQGQRGGTEEETLTEDNLPAHSHAMRVSSQAATATDPSGNVLAAGAANAWNRDAPSTLMPPTGTTGAAAAHSNMQPSLVVNFVVALQGLFPSRI